LNDAGTSMLGFKSGQIEGQHIAHLFLDFATHQSLHKATIEAVLPNNNTIFVNTRQFSLEQYEMQAKFFAYSMEKKRIQIRDDPSWKQLTYLSSGAAVIDEVGTILFVNKLMTTYFGYEFNELVGFNLNKLLQNPIDKNKLSKYSNISGIQLTATAKDGSSIEILFTLNLRLNVEGKATYLTLFELSFEENSKSDRNYKLYSEAASNDDDGDDLDLENYPELNHSLSHLPNSVPETKAYVTPDDLT